MQQFDPEHVIESRATDLYVITGVPFQILKTYIKSLLMGNKPNTVATDDH